MYMCSLSSMYMYMYMCSICTCACTCVLSLSLLCTCAYTCSSEVLSERVAHEKVVELHVIQRVKFPLFPTKCARCGRTGEDLMRREGKKIQRCGKCKAVGYCSR